MHTLSTYAIAHLRLIEIDIRYRRVTARLRKKSRYAVRNGGREGREAIDRLGQDQKLFDLYVHNRT